MIGEQNGDDENYVANDMFEILRRSNEQKVSVESKITMHQWESLLEW